MSEFELAQRRFQLEREKAKRINEIIIASGALQSVNTQLAEIERRIDAEKKRHIENTHPAGA